MDIKLFEIQSVEEIDDEEVYDISILDDDLDFFNNEHNYIANKILVHNSHPAGIVISNVPLETIAPLRTARKGMLATQFTMDQLESIGLIKFDNLSLLTLTVIKRTVKLIKENYDIDIDVENLKVNDDDTFALYRSGNLAGVFQCEQYGMRQTMRDIEVDNFDDIMAGISLFRPGPMDSIPEFCSRKKGMSSVDYFHPSIEKYVKPFLEVTYGILVYQEQIMQICNSLAGFAITDGYIMIKAIGKKKIHLMNRFEKQFIKGCVDNGVPKDVAKQYWDKFIIPFASYGFNKCLDGSVTIKDKITGNNYRIDDLFAKFKSENKPNIILDSCKIDEIKTNRHSQYYCIDSELVEDEVVDIFETGEQDVYEVELDNGMILKCTKYHKFLCSDSKMHTIRDIFYYDLEMLYE